jgi:hypothetical protein
VLTDVGIHIHHVDPGQVEPSPLGERLCSELGPRGYGVTHAVDTAGQQQWRRTMNLSKALALCAMISPILYTFMWILGGIIVPGYSHIRNDVSSLFATGAHARWVFQSLAIICSVLLLVFYAGLHWSTGDGPAIGAVLYAAAALLGVLVAILFPLDAGGEPVTWRGKGHLVLIAMSGVLMIVAMVLMYFRLRDSVQWRSFALFQLITAPVLLAGVIIMVPFTGSRYMGLVERFMVSGYQIFYLISGLFVFLRN